MCNLNLADGMKTVEQFQTNIGELSSELHSIHQRQDAEKRQLNELKTLLKQTIATYKEVLSNVVNIRLIFNVFVHCTFFCVFQLSCFCKSLLAFNFQATIWSRWSFQGHNGKFCPSGTVCLVTYLSVCFTYMCSLTPSLENPNC